MSQRNPNSVNARKVDAIEGSERAARRAALIVRANEASTGDAGVEQGDKAKRKLETDNAA